MDRPEDVEPSPITGRIYIACTKTKERGVHGPRPVVRARDGHRDNAANPRVNNKSGHIIEITEHNDDATAMGFRWNVFLLAGDPAAGRYIVDARELAAGNLGGGGHLLRRATPTSRIEPGAMPRQSRHRSAGPALDRHRLGQSRPP